MFVIAIASGIDIVIAVFIVVVSVVVIGRALVVGMVSVDVSGIIWGVAIATGL